MTESPLRVGFVGCGRQASAAWYPNFATLPEFDLIACCDIDEDRAKFNACHFGARSHHTDLAAMLDTEDLEAVFVVGPPDVHYECGRRVLEAGLHLMMEKPSAPVPSQALELAELAEAKGVITQVGHNMRHAPGVRKFKELMRTQEFGNLLYLESRYFMPSPSWPGDYAHRPGWQYMIFQATHAVDLARHVGGEITSVFARKCVGNDGRFAIASTVTFESGATGAVSLTGATPNWTCKLEAAGDAGAHLRLINLHTLHFEPRSDEGGYRPEPGIPGHYWTPAARDNAEQRSGYRVQMEAFARAVRAGTSDVPTLRDAWRAMRICEAILDSIDVGQPVDLA